MGLKILLPNAFQNGLAQNASTAQRITQGSQAWKTCFPVGSSASGTGGLTSPWESSLKRMVVSVITVGGFQTRRNSTIDASEIPPAATSTI